MCLKGWGGGGEGGGGTGCNISEYDRFGEGSIMVWGSFSIDRSTELLIIPAGLMTAVQVLARDSGAHCSTCC